MSTWNHPAALLEDTDSALLFAHQDSSARNYCWPVWRFGKVLQPLGRDSLQVAVAQEIGSLFKPGQPSAVRYLEQRLADLQALAASLGGRLARYWPDGLVPGSKSLRNLQEVLRPEEILVTYSFVPIVRLPRFLVNLGEALWEVRESLTICGFPAKSKIWVTASLVMYRGQPTDTSQLSKRDLDMARQTFSAFSTEALRTLNDYYLRVLNEDTGAIGLNIKFSELKPVAETEIVSLASNADLEQALNALEARGLRQFRENTSADLPGYQEVLDFLEWTDWPPGANDENWKKGQPKVLAIYAEQPACGSVRALVIPRLAETENRTWYAALTERKETVDLQSDFPLSESAGRFIAREYGRYY